VNRRLDSLADQLDAIHRGIDGRVRNLEMAAQVYEKRLDDLDRATRG